MRKAQKKQIEELLALLEQAHNEIKRLAENRNFPMAMELLGQCQESAVQVGGLIEQTEGGDAPTIARLEDYCEVLYDIHEELSAGMSAAPVKIYKRLRKSLIQVENSIKNDIKIRLEMVFLPYKAGMWDSLESVWMAADADRDCDAYVVPIPYYDKNQDGSFGTFHYEGDRFPDYVPVTHYDAYDISKRRPDAIFIHNPYDKYNNVTSVHPGFYSRELKKYTECLVYVPYYATSGGMSEAQGYLPSYYFVDYIVVQAEKYKKFFDPNLPSEKLLPLGSPKFDKVIRLCQNPPEPPEEWKEKMAGKKVYFYNTSINGMLGDTGAFLRKMEYVFQCFAKCRSACLLWRPHPLLESTFDSMRPQYKPFYEKLKQFFLDSHLGIYDDTPEIEPVIALCDAYVGDSGTSVTALFGAAGKPVFILNNHINSFPKGEDWRGEIICDFYWFGNDQYMVTQSNKLYYAPEGDYRYRYGCDLCEYSDHMRYFPWVISVLEKNYVCPLCAQEILALDGQRVSQRIKLHRRVEQGVAFYGAAVWEKYLLLLPNYYPAIVRYDTVTGEIRYFEDCLNINIDIFQGGRRFGGFGVQNGYLFLASPVNNHVLAFHVESGRMQVMTTGAENNCGCLYLVPDGKDLWLIPYEGYIVSRWNPESGEVREYDCYIDGLRCVHPAGQYECETAPFGFPAVFDGALYLPAGWGNQYLRVDKKTGEVRQWKVSYDQMKTPVNGYYPPNGKAGFACMPQNAEDEKRHIFSYYDKKLYDINLLTGDCQEQIIDFEVKELQKHEAGFREASEESLYVAYEGVFHSLSDFLEGRIRGNPFDRERALGAFRRIAANNDGTSGEKAFGFIRDKLIG